MQTDILQYSSPLTIKSPDHDSHIHPNHFVQSQDHGLVSTLHSHSTLPFIDSPSMKTPSSSNSFSNISPSSFGMTSSVQPLNLPNHPHSAPYSPSYMQVTAQSLPSSLAFQHHQQSLFVPSNNQTSSVSPTDSVLSPPSIDLNQNSPLSPGSYNDASDILFSPSIVNTSNTNIEPISIRHNISNHDSPSFQKNSHLDSMAYLNNTTSSTSSSNTQLPHHDRNQSLPNGSSRQYDIAYNRRVSLNRSATVAESSRPNSRLSNIPLPTINIPDHSFQFPPNFTSQNQFIHTPQITIPSLQNDPLPDQTFQFPSSSQFAQMPQNPPQFQLQPPPIQGNGMYQFPQQQLTIPPTSNLFPQDPTSGSFEITIPDLNTLQSATSPAPLSFPDSFSSINIDPLQHQKSHLPQSSKDIQNTFQFGLGSAHPTPSHPPPSQFYNDSPNSIVNTKLLKSEEFKNPSEYALHILFRQVFFFFFF